jgi:transglutaminase-like putative cysteine protease
MGLAARYVSGYLLTDPPPGQPRLAGADASHAWLSVHCPPYGWVDLDPTNDMLAGVRHITLAWGRDYGDVSPLRGVILGGTHHTLKVGVSVVPL